MCPREAEIFRQLRLSEGREREADISNTAAVGLGTGAILAVAATASAQPAFVNGLVVAGSALARRDARRRSMR